MVKHNETSEKVEKKIQLTLGREIGIDDLNPVVIWVYHSSSK